MACAVRPKSWQANGLRARSGHSGARGCRAEGNQEPSHPVLDLLLGLKCTLLCLEQFLLLLQHRLAERFLVIVRDAEPWHTRTQTMQKARRASPHPKPEPEYQPPDTLDADRSFLEEVEELALWIGSPDPSGQPSGFPQPSGGPFVENSPSQKFITSFPLLAHTAPPPPSKRGPDSCASQVSDLAPPHLITRSPRPKQKPSQRTHELRGWVGSLTYQSTR